MPFIEGTATDYLDLLDILVDFCIEDHVATAVINSGGTGYTVGDVLTVAGGTVLHGLSATIEVTSVSSGVIDGIKILTAGIYTADPTLTANAVTGGTGSGATIDLTMDVGGWTSDLDQTYDTTEREVIMHGAGSGSDEIYIGIRTYRDAGPDIFNWELAGFSGYNSGVGFSLQPGISPGRHDTGGSSVTEGGHYVPLDDASIEFWINVTPRRIAAVYRCSTSSYMQMYLGFLDPFNTDTEWPYPICVGAPSCQRETRFNSTRAALSSLVDPTTKFTGASPSIAPGPVSVRWVDGTWYNLYNWVETVGAATSSKGVNAVRNITPPGRPNRGSSTSLEDNFMLSTTWQWSAIRPESGTTPTAELQVTPGSPDDEIVLFPPVMIFSTLPVEKIVGQYNDVFWCSVAGSGLGSEDEVDIGSDSYILFHAGNQTNSFDYIALKRT